jgi:hypothetical protein
MSLLRIGSSLYLSDKAGKFRISAVTGIWDSTPLSPKDLPAAIHRRQAHHSRVPEQRLLPHESQTYLIFDNLDR